MGKGEGDQGPGERGLGWREGRGDEGGFGVEGGAEMRGPLLPEVPNQT